MSKNDCSRFSDGEKMQHFWSSTIREARKQEMGVQNSRLSDKKKEWKLAHLNMGDVAASCPEVIYFGSFESLTWPTPAILGQTGRPKYDTSGIRTHWMSGAAKLQFENSRTPMSLEQLRSLSSFPAPNFAETRSRKKLGRRLLNIPQIHWSAHGCTERRITSFWRNESLLRCSESLLLCSESLLRCSESLLLCSESMLRCSEYRTQKCWFKVGRKLESQKTTQTSG